MDTTKAWYTSKGVWGGLFAAVLPVAQYYAAHHGITLPSADTLATDVADICTSVAGIVATYGRVTATLKIGKVTPPSAS